MNIEKYYSKRSVVTRYRVIKINKSIALLKGSLVTTKNEGSYVIDSKPITRTQKMFINYLIRSNRVKEKHENNS